jgi:hypothetical protein
MWKSPASTPIATRSVTLAAVAGSEVIAVDAASAPALVTATRRAGHAVTLAHPLELLLARTPDAHGPGDRTWGIYAGLAALAGVADPASVAHPDGREARFPALGPISGDWGGGHAIGMEALSAAVRARDGRGPRTTLEQFVPARFGLRRPVDVTLAIYRDRLDENRLLDLAPGVFAAAGEGDAVPGAILDRLADEVVAMAVAVLRRLHLLRGRPSVVLAGGIFRADDTPFLDRIRAGVEWHAPGARVVRLDPPPVLGAALLALDRLDRSDRVTAAANVRAALTHARMAERA